MFSHWTSYVAGVATLLRQRGARLDGFDLLIQSAVPVGGGLSSSAALEVAAALALSKAAGADLDCAELVDLCREAEHTFAGVPCGIMDQYVSVLARADTALLLDCRTRKYEYIPLPLGDHVVLVVDSGVRHELAASEYAQRQEQCRQAVEYFRRVSPDVRALRDLSPGILEFLIRTRFKHKLAARTRHVVSENQRTLDAAEALRRGDLATLGELMAESHRSLRDDYEVSCPELDRLVEIVSGVEGVIGARMTGGGFGGCIVAIVHQDALLSVAAELRAKYDAAGAARCRLIRTRPGPGASVELP
jgi:galactokinase